MRVTNRKDVRASVQGRPQTVEVWTGSEYREAEKLETNGNLTLVRFPDGNVDWVNPFDIRK